MDNEEKLSTILKNTADVNLLLSLIKDFSPFTVLSTIVKLLKCWCKDSDDRYEIRNNHLDIVILREGAYVARRLFFDLSGVKKIILPDNLEWISMEAFSFCHDLEKVNVKKIFPILNILYA